MLVLHTNICLNMQLYKPTQTNTCTHLICAWKASHLDASKPHAKPHLLLRTAITCACPLFNLIAEELLSTLHVLTRPYLVTRLASEGLLARAHAAVLQVIGGSPARFSLWIMSVQVPWSIALYAAVYNFGRASNNVCTRWGLLHSAHWPCQ